MSLLAFSKYYTQSFIELLFPNLCVACDESLKKNEQLICINCEYELPRTNFHESSDNDMAKKLAGRFPFEQVHSFLHFNKSSKVQALIHSLKYKNSKEVGVMLGKLFGNQLASSHKIDMVDVIIPVPLHISRKRKRGYNQSDIFGQGLSLSTGITLNTKAIKRQQNTSTQTKKSKQERWENVKDAFQIIESENLEGKHILLIDDVMTTGATIEACASELLKIKEVKISVATIAIAD